MIKKMKKEYMFVLGIFSLMIANLLHFFGGGDFILNFLEGMFTGISLVFNLSFLIRFSIEKTIKTEGGTL